MRLHQHLCYFFVCLSIPKNKDKLLISYPKMIKKNIICYKNKIKSLDFPCIYCKGSGASPITPFCVPGLRLAFQDIHPCLRFPIPCGHPWGLITPRRGHELLRRSANYSAVLSIKYALCPSSPVDSSNCMLLPSPARALAE